MESFREMSKEELQAQEVEVNKKYQEFKDLHLSLNMARGIAELTRLGEALGGKPETFSGLTGVGDLIVTCTSVHSRNRKAGYLMGKGMTAEEAMKEVKMVVEGVYSAKAALGLAKKCNVAVPIVEAVNRVLFENADPKEEVSNLLLRERKQEHTNLEWN